MDALVFYISILICILCFQNIYVQIKRNGFVLIWYSVSNSFYSLSYVVGGITLYNGFKIENATTAEFYACLISGLALSLSSVAIAGLALALSVELFVSLRLTNPSARQDPTIKRMNICLAFFVPFISIFSGIIILLSGGDIVSANFDNGGVCEVSRHGKYRIVLFIFRTLPEYLLNIPASILSVFALIPVAKKVFENRRLQNSLSIPWAIDKEPIESSVLPTRGGPPPNPSIPPNAKMLLPRNVLLRMGLWCCLLIIFGIPTSIVIIKKSIEYLINGNAQLNYFPIDTPFWQRNGHALYMILSSSLFLLCFGTGEFANKQYRDFWIIIFGYIFCRPKRTKTSKHQYKHNSRTDFEIYNPSSSHNSYNRVSPTTTVYTPRSYLSHHPPSQSIFSNCSYPMSYNEIFRDDYESSGSPELIMTDVARPKEARLSDDVSSSI
ncbi:6158_t:CDS:2 [Funneliformis geosporum]|uniref:14573_t:CDS:1 n=1 Tax=Funneliformis geosporum TaxID=1117311 RepID=A0A9W4SV64_9GLOM|nr:14573_t:CDS:2 [Funneliformis geosporum]CAI2186125.1 6158_t:CDS:2 [Funneliformis geosporum]